MEKPSRSLWLDVSRHAWSKASRETNRWNDAKIWQACLRSSGRNKFQTQKEGKIDRRSYGKTRTRWHGTRQNCTRGKSSTCSGNGSYFQSSCSVGSNLIKNNSRQENMHTSSLHGQSHSKLPTPANRAVLT